MLIKVLGSAAGGGLPQWNCNGQNSAGVRKGVAGLKARTQASVAVSADGRDFVLLNASPDLRQQISETPELQPATDKGPRNSPIKAVVLTNGDVIAVDQDSLGVEGFRYAVRDSVEIWFKPLAGGDWALTFLNRATSPRAVSFDWAHEVVSDTLSHRDAQFSTTRYQLRNLWTLQSAGTTARPLSATVPGRDVLMLRLKKS